MNFYVFLPVFALTLWLASIYIDSKFSYRSPAQSGVALNESATWWKKLIVHKNYAVKSGALFAIWIFISLDVYLNRFIGRSTLHYVALVGAGVSMFVYAIAQGWRILVSDTDKARS